jgi:hypothetical protein
MDTIFPLAGALLVLLEVSGAITTRTAKVLPIGGSHISQLAIVFGFAFVIYEVTSILHGR